MSSSPEKRRSAGAKPREYLCKIIWYEICPDRKKKAIFALPAFAPRVLEAVKDLMVLSVGALLHHPEWLTLAACYGERVYVPSGAIIGLDGLKGACTGHVDAVTVHDTHPPQGLAGAPYVEAHGINVYAYG